jgi:hypothetical protein
VDGLILDRLRLCRHRPSSKTDRAGKKGADITLAHMPDNPLCPHCLLRQWLTASEAHASPDDHLFAIQSKPYLAYEPLAESVDLHCFYCGGLMLPLLTMPSIGCIWLFVGQGEALEYFYTVCGLFRRKETIQGGSY